MTEMIWLGGNNLISSWQDYDDMPLGLLMDARLLMEYESAVQEKARRSNGVGR